MNLGFDDLIPKAPRDSYSDFIDEVGEAENAGFSFEKAPRGCVYPSLSPRTMSTTAKVSEGDSVWFFENQTYNQGSQGNYWRPVASLGRRHGKTQALKDYMAAQGLSGDDLVRDMVNPSGDAPKIMIASPRGKSFASRSWDELEAAAVQDDFPGQDYVPFSRRMKLERARKKEEVDRAVEHLAALTSRGLKTEREARIQRDETLLAPQSFPFPLTYDMLTPGYTPDEPAIDW